MADTERFEEIVEGLKAGGIDRKASFSFAVRANLVTDRLCERIKMLRVDSVCFGAESGSDRVLASMKKGTSVAGTGKTFSIFSMHIAFPCSAPSSSGGRPKRRMRSARRTNSLLGNIKAGKLTPGSVVNILTPMPGTETWRDAVKNGALPETGFDWGRLSIRFV